MDVIEEIYRESIRQSKRSIRRNKEYTRIKNQINHYYQVLCKNLSEREVEALHKLMSCYDTKIETENMQCFKSGLRTGLATIKELE